MLVAKVVEQISRDSSFIRDEQGRMGLSLLTMPGALRHVKHPKAGQRSEGRNLKQERVSHGL